MGQGNILIFSDFCWHLTPESRKRYYGRKLIKCGEDVIMDLGETTRTSQYLTFMLGKEDFALAISKVREVVDFLTITKVPRMPEFLSGVINLRGNVVPVVDLRLKLGVNAGPRTVDTCIMIVDVDMDGEDVQMGAIADAVQEVIDLEPDMIQPPPRLGTGINTAFIKGMGKRNDSFIIILDIDKVLSDEELAKVCLASENRAPADESEEAGEDKKQI